MDEPIDLVTTANDRVEMTCGDGIYKIIGLPDEEFPQLPSVEGEALSIGGETLIDVIQKTEYAASTEEVRYFLNGLYFNLLTDRTEVVATDGKRLALIHCEPLNASEEDQRVHRSAQGGSRDCEDFRRCWRSGGLRF